MLWRQNAQGPVCLLLANGRPQQPSGCQTATSFDTSPMPVGRSLLACRFAQAAIFQRANKLALNGVFILKDVATMEDVVVAMMQPPKPIY